MAELALLLFLAALATGTGWVWRNPRAAPSALWIGAWAVLLASGVSGAAIPNSSSLPPASHFAGMLFPALLLAGALAYAARDVPRWLLPSALALGAVRLALVSQGHEEAGYGLALAVEPALVLAAAAGVHRASSTEPAPAPWPRLLAVALVGIAGLEAASALFGMRTGGLPPILIGSWLGLGLTTLVLQLGAISNRTRQLFLREQRHIADALSRSEERFRALTENIHEWIVETDREGRVTYTNPRFIEALEPGARGVTDRPLFEWIHPDDRNRFQRWHAALTDAPGAPPILARFGGPSGGWRWVESTGRLFQSPAGGARAVLSSRDVTERERLQGVLAQAREDLEKRVEERTRELARVVAELERENARREHVEQRLRASEERYRIVSELSSDLSFALRVRSGGVLVGEWVTRAFSRITGYTPEEILARGWSSLSHPDDWEAARAYLEAAARGAACAFQSRIVTKRGEVRWLHVRLTGAPDDRGEMRVIGAVRDITERRRAEEEQRRLERHMQDVQKLESLGLLAGGLAHDFNNLLSVILGNAKLLLARPGPDREARRRMERIQTAARHAAGLTDQMLAYAGRASVSLAPLDLSALVTEMLDLLRASVSKKCTVEVELEDDLSAVDGDPTQMRQVLMNLVTNASDALEGRPGGLCIRTGVRPIESRDLVGAFGDPDALPGRYVFLEVSDSGPGIADADRARVFTPFYTTKSSGRGLGLASVLGIVRQHAGVIQLESEPGRGSTFRVLLPARERLREPDAAAARPERRIACAGTILVVDDEEAVRELAGEILRRAGYRVVAAANGADGILRLEGKTERIEVVLLDLTMPGMDGAEALSAIRRTHPALPVILTTGYNEERTAERVARDAHTGFLRKPYEPEELIRAIKISLGS